jgi:hypothetical protein
MSRRPLAAVFVAAIVLAACAPQAEPLTLEERVPTAEDAPGTEPDPLETPVTVTGIDEFEAQFLAGDPTVTDADVQVLEDAGFVAAISAARYYPGEEGAGHDTARAHIFTIVMQFDSAGGTQDVVAYLQDFNLRTCPEVCAFASAEFDVDGIPDALGAQQIATQESLDEVGDPGEPMAIYAISFADGPFVYDVRLAGAPEEVSEEEAEEIAQTLYERVKGAPPAESD